MKENTDSKPHTATVEIPDDVLEWLTSLQPGDTVKRTCGSVVSTELLVSEVDDEFVHCGPWKFSKRTSAEVNEELGWDEENTGSLISAPDNRSGADSNGKNEN
jgi:hypothetical protein